MQYAESGSSGGSTRSPLAVGNGALFLDEDTEHARFQKG